MENIAFLKRTRVVVNSTIMLLKLNLKEDYFVCAEQKKANERLLSMNLTFIASINQQIEASRLGISLDA